jgi:hypothetical protein
MFFRKARLDVSLLLYVRTRFADHAYACNDKSAEESSYRAHTRLRRNLAKASTKLGQRLEKAWCELIGGQS